MADEAQNQANAQANTEDKPNDQAKKLESARAHGGKGREKYRLNPETDLKSYAFADGEIIHAAIPRHYTSEEAKKYADKVRGKAVLVKTGES